ncbi:hypothetical protein [Amnibacterium kyonggiense]
MPFTTSDSPEGRLVAGAVLDRPGWKALRPAVSLLEIPTDAEEYVQGASKQTLRRKMRSAQKAGVVTRDVEDRGDRIALLAAADEYERLHARAEYRNADADNTALLQVGQWIGAYTASGEPLMLSITPVDGSWASLNYFRTFSSDPAATDTRYLMTKILVDHLAERGVRHLADTVHPAHLQNGLRHFQRVVGFRIHRIVVDGTADDGVERNLSTAGR